MAEVQDVMNVIASAIAPVTNALVGQTYTIPSAVDAAAWGPQTITAITVAAGNVLLRTLMTRLEAGKGQIQVESDDSMIHTAQYMNEEPVDLAGVVVPTTSLILTPSNNGNTTTITGTIQTGNLIGVTLGSLAAAYAVLGSDSTTTIATALAAAAVTAGMVATSSSNSVTITPNRVQGIPTFASGASFTRNIEGWRRRKIFCATILAPNPYLRQFIGRAVESIFPPASRLTMPDGTTSTILGMDSYEFGDDQQRDMTYFRRVRWLVDFVNLNSTTVYQVVAGAETLTPTLITQMSFSAPTSQQL